VKHRSIAPVPLLFHLVLANPPGILPLLLEVGVPDEISFEEALISRLEFPELLSYGDEKEKDIPRSA
jgi:hypothetical protein